MMNFNEADTRAKLIDPAIHKRGWTEDMIRREETAGALEIFGGKPRRRAHGKIDYVLRVRVNIATQPVALALVEAKKSSLPAGFGLDQAKGYAECRRMNVKFVFSSNGYQFVEFDFITGKTSVPRPLVEFPTPDELRARYEQAVGFKLASPEAKPLLQPYPGGEGSRRYYQDAAIRAVMEKIAADRAAGNPPRALLSLATGAGKTFIAVNLLKRITDAGQLTRALFLCDRDELRSQAVKAFQNVFGADAAEVKRNPDGLNNARNARIHIATYQTLGIDTDNGDASFLTTFYPDLNSFSHIVIDECHRSAWGKWSQVLTRNEKAVQIGLTATPRQIVAKLVPQADADADMQVLLYPSRTDEANELALAAEGVTTRPVSVPTDCPADAQICADNWKYFGVPVYEYDMAQAIEDGYLAACEIQKGRVNIDETGITKEQIIALHPVNAVTGLPVTAEEIEELYRRTQYEDRILLPDRVLAMGKDLFNYLLQTGCPEQKTIIFCARDRHADDVAVCLNNLYADWCRENAHERAEYFAFKCTAASSGNDQLPDLRSASRSHFIATTVELLTTGVDVPVVRNIVFFKYLKSPISFYQMVGRGMRIDVPSGKLMFRVYDYTDATRLFGEEFVTKTPGGGGGGPGTEPPPIISVDGFDVEVSDAGRFVVVEQDGRAMPVPVDEYKARVAARLVAEVHTIEDFRARWVDPPARQDLLDALVGGGYSPSLVRIVDGKDDYDLYDVLAELGWGAYPRTRHDRVLAFSYKHEDWLRALPEKTAATLRAVANQFERGGTEGLESRQIFNTPAVKRAGGMNALSQAGNPRELLIETKTRMFAA